MDFAVISVFRIGEFSMIFVIRCFVNRNKRNTTMKEASEDDNAVETK